MKRRNVTSQSPGAKSNSSAKNSNNSANLASRLSKQLSNSDTASEVEKPGKSKKKKKRKSNKKKESVGSPSSDETSMYYFIPTILVKKAYHNYSKYWGRQAYSISVDPDQTLQNAASDQGLQCLPFIQQYFSHINSQ